MTYIPEGFNRKRQDEQDVSWVMWQQQRSEAKARSWWSSKSIGTKLYAEASWFKTRLPRGPGNGFHVGREWHWGRVSRKGWTASILDLEITNFCCNDCNATMRLQDQIEFRERLTCRTWWFSHIFSSLQLFSWGFLARAWDSGVLRLPQPFVSVQKVLRPTKCREEKARSARVLPLWIGGVSKTLLV